MNKPMCWRQKTARYVGAGLAAIGVIGAFVSFFITTKYLQSAPLVPKPEAGIVYAVKARGEVIYLSWSEYVIQMGLLPASFVITMIGAAILVWSRKD